MVISPDTKDWTWVLERPCPECGFDAARVAPGDVSALLEENARAWRPVLEAPGAATRPSPDRWSALEYACHVRDVYTLFAERLDLMLTEDDPLFANWDQDATAVDEAYGEQDPVVVADELEDAGLALARAFAGVREDQWARRGRRSDGASFTVDSFSRYLAHDPVHHLWDVGR